MHEIARRLLSNDEDRRRNGRGDGAGEVDEVESIKVEFVVVSSC